MFKSLKRINFYDCDPAGILFFGRVYELCHSAYEELIESFNLNEDYWSNDFYIVPILKSEAQYRKHIKYGESISVEINVINLKSSSFELEYICRNKGGEECVVVKTVHVFVDKATWKKSTMKALIHDGLLNHLVNA
jgi:acyl-CoA thioester hydrolase/1,4-dihydroxy-2-naphthoyl-CoA hydrolase